MRILIVCTGNSCRSQMAEGFLKSFDKNLQVFSAGTNPARKVNPFTITVMSEMCIDLTGNHPKNADEFTSLEFDYVITVCDGARETCPVFTGKVGKRLHIGFEDPAEFIGTAEETLQKYRQVRDEIQRDFRAFYDSMTAKQLDFSRK
ncbi:MAG TPA: arsenate reductase ArsC [Bacteroidales bacterium]|nr:arsenate reductase ArsC [Bacteroidales bacterium]HNS46474.1 arsenate reductase ArsC [Bacteroidales bacterium]